MKEGKGEGSGDKTDGVIRVMQGRLLERSDFTKGDLLEWEQRPVRIAALNLEGERRMARLRGGKGRSQLQVNVECSDAAV